MYYKGNSPTNFYFCQMASTAFLAVLNWVDTLLNNKQLSFESKLEQLCEKLQKEVGHYDWVGFYFAQAETQTLHLKAFAGLPTEHHTIPFGKGICGQVALSNQLLNVPQVQEADNYIACSLEVQSELVVPLIVNGQNVGQIDIDSHTPNAFDAQDEAFLLSLCQKIALHYSPI